MWKGTSKSGKPVTLLNPAEKGRKYVEELRNGFKLTNDGRMKTDKNGAVIPLTDSDIKFRSGYLSARSDSARIFKKKNPNYCRNCGSVNSKK